MLQFVGRLAGAIPGGAGVATQVGLSTEYGKAVGDEPRVWGAWFTGQDIPHGSLALSYGVDCRQLPLALATLLQTVQAKGKVPCVVATRFVPRSTALLAMNRYPRTCMIDVDGANVPAMGELHAECGQALQAAGVTFTLHWGKSIDTLSREQVERAYGTDLTRWRTARRALLPDPKLSHTFSNDVVDALLL